MSDRLLSRRIFVLSSLAAGVGMLIDAVPRRADHGPHPTPRPGIDASHVLTHEQLKDAPDATFMVRYADSQLRATIDPPAYGDPAYG